VYATKQKYLTKTIRLSCNPQLEDLWRIAVICQSRTSTNVILSWPREKQKHLSYVLNITMVNNTVREISNGSHQAKSNQMHSTRASGGTVGIEWTLYLEHNQASELTERWSIVTNQPRLVWCSLEIDYASQLSVTALRSKPARAFQPSAS
jgi:hypothetical protein